MRVLKLLMLGVLLVAAAKCFEGAFTAAQDTREVLSREKWKAHTLVVHGRRLHAQASLTPVEPAAEAMVFEPLELVPPEDEVENDAPPPPPPVRRTVPRRHRVQPAPAPEPASELAAPEDAIRMALRRKRLVFEHCYEMELKKQAAFNGFVVLSVSVTADGRITDAHVEEGSRRDAAVGACIVGQLRQLKLPPLTEEADLLIPIRLEARKDT